MGKKTSLKTKNKEILDTMIVNPINRRESFESRATLEHFETIDDFMLDNEPKANYPKEFKSNKKDNTN